MRAFVFLLILANLMFLAWAQGFFAAGANPDALRVEQQLLADRIRIVARDDAEAASLKIVAAAKAPEKKPVEMCLLLGDLTIIEAERVEKNLAEKLPGFKAQRMAVDGKTSYWVFIPPLPSKQDADSKAAELKRLGIPEFFVVQESGPNNRAISLGLFSSHDAASARLDALRAKGVKSARIVERNARGASASLEISGPETRGDALRQLLADTLPETRPAACTLPSPAT